MTERIIKLVLEEPGSRFAARRQVFVISVGENGAEIRRSSSPVVERDKSVLAFVGVEPNIRDVILRVEEQL